MDLGSRNQHWPRAGEAAVVALRRQRLGAEVAYVTSQSVGLRVSLDQRCFVPSGSGTKTAALEYVTPGGTYRVVGELGAGEPGVARFAPRAQPLLVERRGRARSDVAVVIVLSDPVDGRRVVGRTRNLSPGGALVGELDGTLRSGERLRYALVPSVGRDGFSGACRVTRAGDGVVAVAFDDVAPRRERELAHFILQHVR